MKIENLKLFARGGSAYGGKIIKNSGFTLMELVLYFGIFAMIATLGTATFSYTLKGKNTISAIAEVHENTQKAMEIIVNRVHLSNGIDGASSTLNLAMASSTLNPTIFSLSSNAIMMREGSNPAYPITPSDIKVTSLIFTQINNPAPSTSSVQIIITANSNSTFVNASGTVYTLQTTALPLQQ